MPRRFFFILVLSVFIVIPTYSTQFQSRLKKPLIPAAEWLAKESNLARVKISESMSSPGTVSGVVIASPQKQNPNYFRHWIRDAALTMEVVVQLNKRSGSQEQRRFWQKHLHEYALFSRQNQLANTPSDLGEPIFEVNGQPFRGPWGRPQNDGPAQRAIALIGWAHELLDQGQTEYVTQILYSSLLPARTVIKADLEYVSHHWQAASFDLWEEVKGDHFYTRMVQRKALLLGAALAIRLKDSSAANWYRQQAKNLEVAISRHWKSRSNLIIPTLNRVEGADYKTSNIDIAVLLGVLHGQQDSFFGFGDPRVAVTFKKAVEAFDSLYAVNRVSKDLAPAIGRYPEDRYAGGNFDGGNPWVLATLAAAEYCYQVAASGRSKEWQELGDKFVQRVQYHANPDGSLSEQIQRQTGYMTSARDLTWNYSAILTTAWARQKASQSMTSRR